VVRNQLPPKQHKYIVAKMVGPADQMIMKAEMLQVNQQTSEESGRLLSEIDRPQRPPQRPRGSAGPRQDSCLPVHRAGQVSCLPWLQNCWQNCRVILINLIRLEVAQRK